MRKLCLSFLFLVACQDGPPAKTASGERVEKITIQEQFATSSETKDKSLTGDDLRAALALMDKHGVTSLDGTFQSKSVVEKGTVTIITKPVTGKERKIVLKSCVHKDVCAFLEGLASKNLLEHKPVACNGEADCDK